MKIGIGPKSKHCKYYVNKEKGKVVCVIEDVRWLLWDFLDKNDLLFAEDCEKYCVLPYRFVGIATCSKDDEWDEELGKLIAFDRAKYKLNLSFFKRASVFINKMDDALNRTLTKINDYGEKISRNHVQRQQYIDEKLKKSE